MRPKDVDEMANSVDPEQTSQGSSLICVHTICSDMSVKNLRIITVYVNIVNVNESFEYI